MHESRSTELNELFKALAMAQSEIKVALKDSSNPFFKSKYANLQAVIEASRPALCKNGLTVMQPITYEEGESFLVSILGHQSGQWILSKMKINPVKQDIQSMGSYITYLRRYSYASLIGVYDGEEDDDGHQATQIMYATSTQVQKIFSLLNNNHEFLKELLAQFGVKDIKYLRESDANKIIDHLSK